MLYSAYSSASSSVMSVSSMSMAMTLFLLYTAIGRRSTPPVCWGTHTSVHPMQANSSPSASSASGLRSSKQFFVALYVGKVSYGSMVLFYTMLSAASSVLMWESTRLSMVWAEV